ncbi:MULTISPECIES: glycoside hydrolase family 125 protein [Microbacterium]|uniref:Glycoside hydrolase family 125 protein n=1 Tax=Microbacterium wangchenii TaxID=2541726 RepID=A0ABX5SWB4_9MICO|nr:MULTISPECIES: glycoside hydrolase family 125 protein [Microbacterium]MCK6066193.1 glycoside hydrolase family 125 protein [Microbacterium sp. EYE_512]QBR90466.1 glycoside hydrolase family 125 protein [Microbacterium wangchenii]TXK14492.1 glycoside hydrolase family 125 protein [Microbacterium wangchenii]
MNLYSPDLANRVVATVVDRLGADAGDVFRRCFLDTLDRTIEVLTDGTAFVVTGDIPAMWLRDSTVQLTPYLHFLVEDEALADTAVAVSRRQLGFLLQDPYANAFNRAADGGGHQDDLTDMSPAIWERKYEIDSLAYPLQLAHDIWRLTGRTDHLGDFREAARTVVSVWRIEQEHESRSPYRFQRTTGPASDSLERNGLGRPTAVTGLTWSGFRPSDDACVHHYNVPGNMMAATVLGDIAELAESVFDDSELAASSRTLRAEVVDAVARHAVVSLPSGSEIYAYEIDGCGNALLTDDANTPSLLSMPLFGWCAADDPTYLATRAFVLSDANPTFFRGTAAEGIGSPHTPHGSIWPIALAVQGLTALDDSERRRVFDTLLSTHAGTGAMHESFDKDDPAVYTRPWFSWANAMFCELALELAGLRTHVRRPTDAETR